MGGGDLERAKILPHIIWLTLLYMMFTQFLSSRAGTFLSSIGTHHNMTHCLQYVKRLKNTSSTNWQKTQKLIVECTVTIKTFIQQEWIETINSNSSLMRCYTFLGCLFNHYVLNIEILFEIEIRIYVRSNRKPAESYIFKNYKNSTQFNMQLYNLVTFSPFESWRVLEETGQDTHSNWLTRYHQSN
jgi:hypothetical protein